MKKRLQGEQLKEITKAMKSTRVEKAADRVSLTFDLCSIDIRTSNTALPYRTTVDARLIRGAGGGAPRATKLRLRSHDWRLGVHVSRYRASVVGVKARAHQPATEIGRLPQPWDG
ncbi:hypothetical protein EVAR_25901_1 [Eumeta japonica]|uniref:Uncharacterized protein n=1 Tax=Eumeta variegata TaxID=151549 RepID=A0A4C1W0X5_EUMVA|nr:hypothetical protein EVAR_25901_1 [Eumeta japonica]